MTVKRYINENGEVGVVISEHGGWGWSHSEVQNNEYCEILCMDYDIVQAVLDGDVDKIVTLAREKCGGWVDTMGADGLVVEWIPKGSRFYINCFDGNETPYLTA